MTEQELDKVSKEEIIYNEQKREWWKQGARFIIENQLAEKNKRIKELEEENIRLGEYIAEMESDPDPRHY